MKSHYFKLYRPYSISFNLSNVSNFFRSWILKHKIKGQEKKTSRCLVFTSSTKREMRHFHVVVVPWWQRNVQKSMMHVQICCFVYLNLLLFCRSHWHRHRCCLSSLITITNESMDFLLSVVRVKLSEIMTQYFEKGPVVVPIACTV